MLLIGLTGGLASGKTTIARMFHGCGAHIIDADWLAREVVRPRKSAWKKIIQTFGKSILTPEQTLDREILARVVFGSPGKLKQLTDIIYPYVAREQGRRTREIQRKDPDAVIVYDAAMLIEARAHTRMDKVIVVKATRAIQITRACHRGKITKAEALRRLRHQMPLRDKLFYADYVIDGTLPLTQLRAVVHQLYQEFCRQACLSNMG